VSILEEQVKFFEKLFTSEGWDSDSAAYLLNDLEKKLSQEDKEIRFSLSANIFDTIL
jgi:hypothetical protein